MDVVQLAQFYGISLLYHQALSELVLCQPSGEHILDQLQTAIITKDATLKQRCRFIIANNFGQLMRRRVDLANRITYIYGMCCGFHKNNDS
jgi:hypothetical protein